MHSPLFLVPCLSWAADFKLWPGYLSFSQTEGGNTVVSTPVTTTGAEQNVF